MIKSMTGYGKAETEIDGKKITVEIRSLNSKQLDLTVKTPSAYRQYEYEIRSEITKRMQRGKTDVYVSYETESKANTVTINQAAFNDYFSQLSAICKANNLEATDSFMSANLMQSILKMPEVVQNETTTLPDEEVVALKNTVTAALDHIDEFRVQEGAILITDLLKRIDTIEQLKEEVTPYEIVRTEAVKTRIKDSIAAMNIQVDNNRLEQEIIFYVEKLDVTEEKVRLANHCKYFREVAHEEDGVGRKLGFIAQEIGREINTLGSKANESNIQKIVVQMKDELEKIKEQLLNIL